MPPEVRLLPALLEARKKFPVQAMFPDSSGGDTVDVGAGADADADDIDDAAASATLEFKKDELMRDTLRWLAGLFDGPSAQHTLPEHWPANRADAFFAPRRVEGADDQKFIMVQFWTIRYSEKQSSSDDDAAPLGAPVTQHHRAVYAVRHVCVRVADGAWVDLDDESLGIDDIVAEWDESYTPMIPGLNCVG
jgi:hypothetical protein